jgi:hypothetical protein
MYTGNDPIKMAYCARHLFFISFILVTTQLLGQNISKYYTSAPQTNGTLFFILPQGEFENNKLKNKLTFDITYLTSSDSAIFNFSYFDRLERTIDSVAFVSSTERFTSSAKKLFIETHKSKWHYRYSSNILFSDLNKFFDDVPPPKIILFTQEGAIELNAKPSHWKKQSVVTTKIFTLIKYNQ